MSNFAEDSFLHLEKVRLAFPWVVLPQKRLNEDGNERVVWSADFIIEPESVTWKNITDRINKVALDAWKEQTQGALTSIKADRKKRCFGKGNEKVNQKSFEIYKGYKDMNYLSASNVRKPQLIDGQNKAVSEQLYEELAKKMYGGCYVNALVNIYAQKHEKYGIGIRCGLMALQFASDGKPFGKSNEDLTPFFKPVVVPMFETPVSIPSEFL